MLAALERTDVPNCLGKDRIFGNRVDALKFAKTYIVGKMEIK
ncbi:MAG: hypothetical protein ACJAUP_002169 [Cellvibrionaceae bacterium]|jgi:hypothetical protein